MGDELRLRLDRLGDLLPSCRRRVDDNLSRQLAQRVALHSNSERLVVTERRGVDLESAGNEAALERMKEFLRRSWRRERGTQVRVRIEHDPFRANLGRDLLDVRRRGLRSGLWMLLIPLLGGDEADESLVHAGLALRR